MSYYDEEGNPIEGVLSPEEVESLQSRIAELEEKEKEAEELKAALETKEVELAKLTDKEFNFQRFREAKKAEKDQMLKGFNAKEKGIVSEIDQLRSEIAQEKSAKMQEVKSVALKELAGEDVELQKKIEDAVKESSAYLGEPKDNQELIVRYQNAYKFIVGTPKTVNPLNMFVPTSGSGEGVIGAKRYTDTPEGRANFKKWFGVDINN